MAKNGRGQGSNDSLFYRTDHQLRVKENGLYQNKVFKKMNSIDK